MSISRIERVSPRSWSALLGVSKIEVEAFGNEGMTPANLCLIALSGWVFAAFENREVVGEALVLGSIGEARALLFSLAVTTSFRRRGLGARLLKTAINDLSVSGIHFLELTVSPSNESALDLYQNKFGFTLVSDEPHFFGPDHPRLILRREIETSQKRGGVAPSRHAE